MEPIMCSLCHTASKVLSCSCTSPAIPICTTCISQHIGTTGSHCLTPALEVRPDESLPRVVGETCDECRNTPSAYFCVCTDPPSQLCESHCNVHILKSASKFHQWHPISAWKCISSGRVKLESFNKRQAYVSTLEAKVNSNIAGLDRFIKACADEFERAVQALHNQEAKLKKELDEVRNQLLEVLNTIKRRRYEVNYMATTWLEHWVLDGYLTESFPDMNLFSGSINVQPILDMIRTCSPYKKDVEPLMKRHLYLPVLKGNNVRLFDVPPTPVANEFNLDLPTNINGGTMYCFIDPVTLLCCGGYNQNEVYKVNLEKRLVVQMKEMNDIRRHAGIWKLHGYVYLFAGYIDKDQKYVTSAEKFSLSANTWKKLSTSLNASKHMCSVCEHKTGLYISGIGASSVSVELFEPGSEIFTLITVNHPTPRYCPFSLVLGDELFIMFNTSLLTATLGSGEIAFTKKEVDLVRTGHYCHQSPLVELGGEFFFVWNLGQVQPGGLAKFIPGRSLVELHLFTY